MNARRVALAALAGVAGALLAASPAQAATGTAVEGPGLKLAPGAHHKGRLHAGQYILAGHRMYCVDYGAATGDGPVRQTAADQTVAYIVNQWGNTVDPVQSADVYLAVNDVAGSSAFHADEASYLKQMPDKGARVKAMVDQAKRLHGPWKVAVVAPKAAPGATVTAAVKVLSAAGYGVPGVPVKVSGVGATVTGGSTNGAGVSSVRVTPKALSYTLSASVSGPWGQVWTNTPSKGHQRLVGAGPSSTASGSACATVCPVSARVVIDAACDDRGKHQVTVTFTAENIPGNYRAVVAIGTTRSVADLAPGETRELTGVIVDGQALRAGFQALDSAGNVVVERTLYAGGTA